MTIFYTSDSHFDHENIISFCDRPFSSAKEMNEIMIQRWNEVVKPSDHVWHLGDVTVARGSKGGAQARHFINTIKRLRGHKRLILGNHDHFPTAVYLAAGFEKVQACHCHNGLFLTHIPIHPSSMGRHLANVHGHIHNQPSFAPVARVNYSKVWEGKEPVMEGFSPYVNICVEQTNYRPISLDELWVKVKELA